MNIEWNAGDMGCGQLAFELSRRMKNMSPGETIRITASDPGAPVDIPAWCRMTGHTLVSAQPPVYVIERKSE